MQSGLSGNPDTYSKPDMKYGFEYDAADNMMVYGTYSTSYRSGNSMAMQQADGDYPPNEELDAYTLGLKSRWFDNRLQVNVSAYYYDYSNKLCAGFKEGYVSEDELYDVDTISPSESGRNGYAAQPDGVYPSQDIYDFDGDGITDEDLLFHITDRNAQGYGAFSSLGIDISTTWIITSKDRLNLSIAYLDAEWETLFFDYEYDVFEDESYAGVTPANSPKMAITASYQHNFTLGSLGNLTPRIDMKYKSEFDTVGEWKSYVDPYGYGIQEAYTMWDASAAFEHSSGRWSLNAYVKNITDYAVKTQARVTTMRTEMRLGDPRTFGATFSIKF
jgi:iron complex outermembrane receptor protein